MLRLQGLSTLALALLDLFVQPRVLDDDRELRRERGDEIEFVRRRHLPWLRVDGKQPDQILAHAKWEANGRLDAGLGELLADRRQPGIGSRVFDQHRVMPAQRAARELDQTLGDRGVRAGEAPPCSLQQAILFRLE